MGCTDPSLVVGPTIIGMLVVRLGPRSASCEALPHSANCEALQLLWTRWWAAPAPSMTGHVAQLCVVDMSLLVSREGPLNNTLQGAFQNGTCPCQCQHGGMRSQKMSAASVSVPKGSVSCLLPLQKNLQDQQPRCLSDYFLCIGTWSV